MKRILPAALLCLLLNLLPEWILPKLLFADSDDLCGEVASALQPPYIPTTGTFRVLIVFVQFEDDTFDGPPSCVADATDGWPSDLHDIPDWATGTKLVHPSVSSSYTSGSMSDYYPLLSG